MKKRIKTILSLTIAAITATAAITAQAAQFSDISPDHWAYNSVTKMAERGVFSGYEDGTFRPGQAMTHEEFVKTIVEYVAPNSVTPKGADYQQVATDDPTNPQYWTNHWSAWAQPYLDKALELGLIGDGSDASNKKIATLLDDYDEIINGVPVTAKYKDGSDGLVSLEIDIDDTDNITPNTFITREEAARLVTRALYLTRDNDYLYADDVYSSPFEFFYPYLISYKYAGWMIGCTAGEGLSKYMRYYPHKFAGIICGLDLDTGSTEKDGAWGISLGYRRDVIVALLNGIIGTDENCMYNPQQSLTRAEAAAIMLRLSGKNERLFPMDDNEARYDFLKNIYFTLFNEEHVQNVLEEYKPRWNAYADSFNQ